MTYIPMMTDEELSALDTGTATPSLQAKAAAEVRRDRDTIVRLDRECSLTEDDCAVLEVCSQFTTAQLDRGIETGDPNSCWTRLLVAEKARRGSIKVSAPAEPRSGSEPAGAPRRDG